MFRRIGVGVSTEHWGTLAQQQVLVYQKCINRMKCSMKGLCKEDPTLSNTLEISRKIKSKDDFDE